MMPVAKMGSGLFAFVLLSVVLTVSCRSLEGAENATTSLIDVAEGLFRTGRARSNLVYANFVSCAIRYDASCLVDAAGEYFEGRKNELLAQADSEFLKSRGRADPDATPSHVAKSIEKLLSELSGLFRDSLLNFFGARESEEDDEVVDSDGQDNGTSRAAKEAEPKQMRKKKKDGIVRKIEKLIHKILFLVILAAKIHFLLRFLNLGLKFKYWLVSLGYLILRAIEWWSSKHHHEHDSVIHVEHPGYDHHPHFEHEVDDHEYGGGHEYHGSYRRNEDAQDLAYAKQKPEGSQFSWIG